MIPIITDRDHLAAIPREERHRHFLGDATLLRHIQQHDNHEALADLATIKEAGLCVRPFWEEDPHDIEGRVHLDYAHHYPDFQLQLRAGVLERLVQAQGALPDDWVIVVKAGFRP